MKSWLSLLDRPLGVLPGSQLLPSCLSSLSGPEPSGLYPDVLGVLVSLGQVSAPRHTVFSLQETWAAVVVGGGRSSPLAKKEGLWLPARTFCPTRAKKFQKKHCSVQPGRGGRGLPF